MSAGRRDQRATEQSPPASPGHGFFVVGLGASAGGIAPLREFFSQVKTDSGMAYVVVLHLSPQHESNLASVLQNTTELPVTQVTETVKVEPNHVYVIPPTKYLMVTDGNLELAEPERIRGGHTSIDLFFRTLADRYGKDAIAIVLSGTGTDGTLGLRRIKEQGGIAIAQDPGEAEYDAMPLAAIDSAVVDLILTVGEMPERLLSLRRGEERLRLPMDSEDRPHHEFDADALRDVLTLLRLRTGHDFSQYKRPTLLRRITRRVQVHEMADIPAYLAFLREHPEEIPALLRDLLITVTNFFRDHDAFEALESEVIPKLFHGKGANDQLRVWIVGCATGEEAYSIAILLMEYASRLTDPPTVQVFATDIDERAIAEARECRYPNTITLDVTPERLQRFFVKEGLHYRIKKELRERVLFAPHNLLRDPPFSKLDLISCRNLLIYLNRDIQERILAVFHFSLRPGGYLFLGASDSAESLPSLFAAVSKKHRTYCRRPVPGMFQPPAPMQQPIQEWHGRLPDLTAAVREKSGSVGELHHKVVEQLAPPSVLINEHYEVVHISENAGRYLLFSGGELSRNLLKMVRPELRMDLRAALFAARARSSEAAAHVQRVRVLMDGEQRLIQLSVRPVIEAPRMAAGFYLVIFDEIAESPVMAAEIAAAGREGGEPPLLPVVGQLEDELQHTKDQLRLTIEQYETSTEELKASNEELQAINEELRSATEELETSKEELQSLNEELTTVNQEYKEKIDEVSRANSDLQNLMASTDIGTIFLDRAMRIKRYTPRIQELFNITAADIGRPLQHFTHKLDYLTLIDDAQTVLRTLHASEREVSCFADDHWFLVRLVPYRTLEDKIDGVVVTFIDVTSRRQVEEQLRQHSAKLREQALILDLAPLIIRSPDDRIVFWSSGAERIYGYTQQEAVGQVSHDLLKTEFPCLLAEIRAQLSSTGEWEGELVHRTRNGEKLVIASRWVWCRDEQNAPYRILEVNSDISARKRAEAALQVSERRVREVLESLPQLVWTAAADGQWDYLSPQWLRYTGVPERQELGYGWLEQVHADERDRVMGNWRSAVDRGITFDDEFRIRGADGEYGWFQARAVPLRDQHGAISRWFGTNTDIRARKVAEEGLREADRRKNEFMAMLSHELRNPLAPIHNGVHVLRAIGNSDPRARDVLDIIDRQVDHMTHLVRDLLDLSRITHGTIVLEKEPVDIGDVVRQAVEATRHLIDAREHRLNIDLPPEPGMVLGDPVRLVQVLTNLLSNATKYTPERGHIAVDVGQEAEQVVLRVADNGIGIPADLLPSIFDSFTQGQRTLDRTEGGLGLGLSLVKRLVGLHDGSVEARSDGPGCGSEFIVRLPRLLRLSAADAAMPAGRPPMPQVNGRRILIVDDNRDAAETLATLLALAGYDVRQANDGPAAIEVALVFQPQVVLLDIGLPGMDGFEVARRLRNSPQMQKNVVFISISGYGETEIRNRSREVGFAHHLLKPVDPVDLTALLDALTKSG